MNEFLNVGGHSYDKVHLIEYIDDNAGFCAMMTYALNGIRKAIENNWLPVVCFTKKTTRFFYDPDYGENVWEYYFEPVMGLSFGELNKLIDEGVVTSDLIHRYEKYTFIKWHHSDPDRIATFWAKDVPKEPSDWMAEKRQLGREYVAKYIKVKPHILEKVKDFYQTRFDGIYTFGVHIRGTDFAYAEPTPPEEYFSWIHALASEKRIADFRIFLATDQVQFVELFTEEFKDRVIFYQALRSSNDLPVYKLKNVSPYKKGEDVLIDILLLSKCDYLLKGAAAAGEFALWFNPDLDCKDFALQSRFDARKDWYLKPAFLKLNISQDDYIKWRINWFKRFIIPWLTLPWRLAISAVRVPQHIWKLLKQRYSE